MNSAVKKEMSIFQKSDTGNHSGWIIQLFPAHAVEVTCLTTVRATLNTQVLIISSVSLQFSDTEFC